MFLFVCINVYYSMLEQFLNVKESCSCFLTKYSSKVLVCSWLNQMIIMALGFRRGLKGEGLGTLLAVAQLLFL